MNPQSVIRLKRDGHSLSDTEVNAFVSGAVSGDWSRGQVGAMLMALFQRGLSLDETRYLLEEKPKLEAGLDVLTQMCGQHWLVLGDMGELGEDSRALHQQAGRSAKQKQLHRLLALGENSQEAVRSFGENATHFLNQDALIAYIKKHSGSDVNVLIKGSRSMHMEQVVEALVGETA